MHTFKPYTDNADLCVAELPCGDTCNQATEYHEQTWTFFGHWDCDELVMDAFVPGEFQDGREDDGTYEQGLFCDSASAATWQEAWQQLRDEYEGAWCEGDCPTSDGCPRCN